MDNANIQTQQMLAKGGFAAGGMNKDPVSGNEVPIGSLPHEVRDDVPAQLSEGEFVLPADVVRFIGLDRLMKMRDKAKEGLQRMNDIGQMGNSEEAAQNGENPLGQFDEEDDDGFESEIDDIMGNGEVAMAEGGSVPGKSATGQDTNNWLWNPTDVNTVYRTFDPKTGQYDRSFGTAGSGWGGNTVNNRPVMTNEVRDYLTSIGYSGPFDGSSEAWNAKNNRVAAGFGGREGAERANEIVANATAEELEQGPNTRIPELEAFLESKGLKLQEGIQHTPGASQRTWIQRLVGADGKPVAVDAHNDRYSADDRFMDATKLAMIAAFSAAAPGAIGVKSGTALGGAASGATAGGMSAAMNGGDFGDVLKGAVKGGVTGGITGGIGEYGGKAYDFLANNKYLPEGLVNAVDDTAGAIKGIPGKIGSTMKDVFGSASTAADVASTVNAAGNTVLPTVTTVGTAAPGLAATIGSGVGATLGGAAVGAAQVPDKFDKVEVIGKKQPPQDNSPIPGYGLIDPTIVERVPDKAPDAPPKDDGKTKLPKLPIKEAIVGAGLGALAGSGSGGKGTATSIPRGNNPVVDYRPVDAQTEQLFINNRPTGKMKKRNMAVGGDVNLDAYDFFKHG
jgi:hypothetical protein